MVKVDPEDWDYVEIGAIGWSFSVLATVAVEIKTADLLRWLQVSILWPKHLQKLQKHFLDCRRRLLQKEEYLSLFFISKQNMQKLATKMKSTRKTE